METNLKKLFETDFENYTLMEHIRFIKNVSNFVEYVNRKNYDPDDASNFIDKLRKFENIMIVIHGYYEYPLQGISNDLHTYVRKLEGILNLNSPSNILEMISMLNGDMNYKLGTYNVLRNFSLNDDETATKSFLKITHKIRHQLQEYYKYSDQAADILVEYLKLPEGVYDNIKIDNDVHDSRVKFWKLSEDGDSVEVQEYGFQEWDLWHSEYQYSKDTLITSKYKEYIEMAESYWPEEFL